ncbi:hypothetical protein SAMN04488100_1448 [Alkalibacterium putridalgicola]|uniref:Uncharacterized protein n=1 Tax=Alkalibacterium putridalgicola TaxID=426703 RepID=A0A1H7X4G5_9LACT|nr:hypothetical protein [Alkalibacterium putridalgicola]GEK90226.1 hypothetical protein APU01nite_22650 [Alkalibacterium putridalgicola]SEM27998.1 hypothetical protein SAMN04488100_1448 [Alkalibacterium putridalgicola]
MFSNFIGKKVVKLSVVAITIGTVLLQTVQGESVEASELEKSDSELLDGENFNSSNYLNDTVIQSVPSQGGGGGAYEHSFTQYGSSRSRQNAEEYILGFFIGAGLSYVPGINGFVAYNLTPIITDALISRPVVYYKVSTYINETSYGQQIRTSISTYRYSDYSGLIDTTTQYKTVYN